LVQVVGHTTNWELLAELGDWVRGEDFLKLETGLRVLQTDGTAVRLLPWEEVGSYAGDVASMVFIDVGLAQLDLSRVSSRFMALPLQGVEVPW